MKAIIHSLHRTRQNFLWLLSICPTLNSLCLWQFAAFPSLSLNQQCSGSQRTAQAVNPGWRAAMDRACRRVWVQHSQRQWGTPGEKHFWEAVTFTSLKKKTKTKQRSQSTLLWGFHVKPVSEGSAMGSPGLQSQKFPSGGPVNHCHLQDANDLIYSGNKCWVLGPVA